MIKSQKSSTIDVLKQRLDSNDIANYSGYTFADVTTIRCGGAIPLYICPNSDLQLMYSIRQCIRLGIQYYLLGKGSKVLACDSHGCTVVITTRNINSVQLCDDRVYCSAGHNTVVLAQLLARHNLSGGEYLYCLPATIGGAVYMNAGCYGQQTADIVSRVLCYDAVADRVYTISNNSCHFSKRHSVFFDNNLTILGVELQLCHDNSNTIVDKMKGMLGAKLDKQPLSSCSCGSAFFTQDNELPASLLIDRAGLKGYTIGGATVSTKHAGFVINSNNATSTDVLQLLQYIEQTIEEQYNINLCREIIVLN